MYSNASDNRFGLVDAQNVVLDINNKPRFQHYNPYQGLYVISGVSCVNPTSVGIVTTQDVRILLTQGFEVSFDAG